jgi:hypothetical protein
VSEPLDKCALRRRVAAKQWGAVYCPACDDRCRDTLIIIIPARPIEWGLGGDTDLWRGDWFCKMCNRAYRIVTSKRLNGPTSLEELP